MNETLLALVEETTCAAALTVPELMAWATEWFGIEFTVEPLDEAWFACGLTWPDGRNARWYGDATDTANPDHWLRFIAPDTLE